jgi:protein involved in polysaccharide export with SLBB domain
MAKFSFGMKHFLMASVPLAACLAGCAGTAAPPVPPAVPSDARLAADPAYRLGVGDRVRISTYNEPSLTGEFQIGGNGTISFPLIGEVPAQDKTAKDLQQALAASLSKGYLLDPRVTVEVLNFRPFFILGEVERPGRYPTFEGMTVTRAIATAGGFTYRANTKTINIRKRGETVERKAPINDDLRIEPGDVLRVGERYF